MEINGVMKFIRRAKILGKQGEPELRSGVLHFTQKVRKGGGNDTVKVMTCVLILAKVLTYANIHVATDQENYSRERPGGVCFVFSYRCPAPRAICK